MPPFTRKDLAAATTKRPMAWWRVEPLVTRFNVALYDVLFGLSSPISRTDLATLHGVISAALEKGLIDDGGVVAECTPNLAQAFRRVAAGKPFRLDALASEAVKEMIGAYEVLVKGIDERSLMQVYNLAHKNQEAA